MNIVVFCVNVCSQFSLKGSCQHVFLFTFIYTNLIRISLTEYLVEFLTIEVVVRQGWNHFLPEALQRHDLRQHRG